MRTRFPSPDRDMGHTAHVGCQREILALCSENHFALRGKPAQGRLKRRTFRNQVVFQTERVPFYPSNSNLVIGLPVKRNSAGRQCGDLKTSGSDFNGAALNGTACCVAGAWLTFVGRIALRFLLWGRFSERTFKTASSESERKLRERGSIPLLCGCFLPQPGTEGISGAEAEGRKTITLVPENVKEHECIRMG